VKKHVGLALPQIRLLLASDVHEHRLAGLLILVAQSKKSVAQNFSTTRAALASQASI